MYNVFFFFQAEDGIRDDLVTGVQTCALPIFAVPETETQRIPSWQEVATAQTVSRRLEAYAEMVAPTIDWSHIESLRDTLLEGGRRFFENAKSTMRAAGIGLEDPARILFVLRRLGPQACEELFGAGEIDPSYPGGRRPVMETDLVRQTMDERARLLENLRARERDPKLSGRKVVVSSTDVHEFAQFLLASPLPARRIAVTHFRLHRHPQDIVKVAIRTDPDAVGGTAHNGGPPALPAQLPQE